MIRRAGLFGGTLGVALVASSSWPIVQGALAKDHGVMGQTWAIAEPDLLAHEIEHHEVVAEAVHFGEFQFHDLSDLARPGRYSFL